MIPPPQARKTHGRTLAAQYSKSFGICKTPGWMPKLTRSNATRHRSPHPSWPSQYLHHAHAVTTPLSGTRSPHAGPSTPQETTLWRTKGMKVCPWYPKEAIQGQPKGLPQGIQYQPWLMGCSTTRQVWVESRSPQGRQELWSQQDVCSRTMQAGQERQRQGPGSIPCSHCLRPQIVFLGISANKCIINVYMTPLTYC